MVWLWILLGLILIYFIYKETIKPLNYWAKRGVVTPKSYPLIGSLSDYIFGRKHFNNLLIDLSRQFSSERYYGFIMFTRPSLVIKDANLIKRIGIKEFDHFVDHAGLSEVEVDPFISKTLINLGGEYWKKMRATVSPVFTSSKIKIMYQLMNEIAENLIEYLDKTDTSNIEMKEVVTKFTNDVIATTAFGIKTNSFDNPENEFYKTGKELINFSFIQTLKALTMNFIPKLAEILNLKLFDDRITNFFKSLIIDAIEYREKNNIIRPDLIHLLIQARKGELKSEAKNIKDTGFATVEESEIFERTKRLELDDDVITSQALNFFAAGFETVATATCLMAHELALNRDCQQKLLEEIDKVNKKYNGEINYDALLSMKYLDQVVSEVLRLWPPTYQTDRLCNHDITIEPELPHEKTVIIEKGITVVFPISAIHRDPAYFPEPDRFDPDRFSEENKLKIIPGSYIPFGIGPRNCIGSRFALLKIKTLYFKLLSKYEIVAVDKTDNPIKFNQKKIHLSPVDGYWIGLRKRN